VVIQVNGEKQETAAGTTVAALLSQLKITAERVAVERNRLVVRRGTYDQVTLQDGDELEILTFVGGG
jgi:thiazole synthase